MICDRHKVLLVTHIGSKLAWVLIESGWHCHCENDSSIKRMVKNVWKKFLVAMSGIS